MHEIITRVKKNGLLEISPKMLNKLAGKQIKIIYDIEKGEKNKDAGDFIELLQNAPKIKLKNDNITRELLHNRDDDGYLYR